MLPGTDAPQKSTDALLRLLGFQPCGWSWLGGHGSCGPEPVRSRGPGSLIRVGLGPGTLLPLPSAPLDMGLGLRQARPLAGKTAGPGSLQPEEESTSSSQMPRRALTSQVAHSGHVTCPLPAPGVSLDQ